MKKMKIYLQQKARAYAATHLSTICNCVMKLEHRVAYIGPLVLKVKHLSDFFTWGCKTAA